MTVVKNGTLQVPRASIYYEVRGKWPVPLMIHGGGGGADKFLKVADHLADWYTVVTYDRRGQRIYRLDAECRKKSEVNKK